MNIIRIENTLFNLDFLISATENDVIKWENNVKIETYGAKRVTLTFLSHDGYSNNQKIEGTLDDFLKAITEQELE